MAANGEASGQWLKGQRDDLIDVAMEMGATRSEAEKYVDQLGLVPDDIETLIKLDTQAAKDQWTDLWDELGYHPPEVPVGVDTDPAKEGVAEFSGLLSSQPPTDVASVPTRIQRWMTCTSSARSSEM